MSTYFILANWTEQGIKAIKASPNRVRATKRLANEHATLVDEAGCLDKKTLSASVLLNRLQYRLI